MSCASGCGLTDTEYADKVVRRVHHPDRRPGRAILPHVVRRGGGQEDRHRRRPGARQPLHPVQEASSCGRRSSSAPTACMMIIPSWRCWKRLRALRRGHRRRAGRRHSAVRDVPRILQAVRRAAREMGKENGRRAAAGQRRLSPRARAARRSRARLPLVRSRPAAFPAGLRRRHRRRHCGVAGRRRPPGAGVGPRPAVAGAAEGPGRLDPHRRGRPRHRLHRQGRDGPEHPHVARAAGRRGASRRRRTDPHGHGRHRARPVGRGHVRQPHDADDGAAAARRRGCRARDAARRSRRSAGRSPRTASPLPTARSGHARRGATLAYGELTRGEKLVQTLPADVSEPPAARVEVEGRRRRRARRPTAATSSRARIATPPTHAARDAPRQGPARAGVRGEARVARRREAAKRAGRRRSCATATSPASSHPTWRPRTARSPRCEARGGRRSRGAARRTQRSSSTSRRTRSQRGADGRAARSSKGDVEQALASADVKLERRYTVAYIAHAPLEPRAAVAEWSGGDRLTVWTGTQRPFAVRDELAEAFRIPEEKVRVHRARHRRRRTAANTPATRRSRRRGSRKRRASRSRSPGRARRSSPGRTSAPAGLIEVRSGAATRRQAVAWEFHNYNSGPAGIATPYDVANQTIQFHPVELAAAPGLVPRARRDREPLRARDPHGRARARAQDGSARVPAEEPLGRAAEGRASRRRRRSSGGRSASRTPGPRASESPAASRRAATSRRAPRSRSSDRASGSQIRRVVDRVRVRRGRQPRRPAQPDRGRDRAGPRRRAFEAIRFENGRIQNPHFSQYRVPRFPDRSGDRRRASRPEGPALRGRRGDADRRARAGGRGAIFAATGVRLRAFRSRRRASPRKRRPALSASAASALEGVGDLAEELAAAGPSRSPRSERSRVLSVAQVSTDCQFSW